MEVGMLAVTGIGMVSALGLDAVASCAAARAGLGRAAGLDEAPVYDESAEALVPLVGHRVPIVSQGLFGFARLVQMTVCAIDDLRRTRPAASERPVGFILVVRSEQHRTTWLERLRQNPALSNDDIDLTVEQTELAVHRQRLTEALLPNIVDRAQISIEARAQRTILGDQVGFVTAIEQAAEWLANGTCETCWVGGVDSYLDPQTLQALEGLELLKTPGRPVGLIPGELACVLALELPHQARRQQRRVDCVISSFAQATGLAHRLTDETPTAEPLVQAMSAAGGGRSMALGVVNLNGDPARASEWGTALIRRTSQGLTDGTPTWVPPLSFGEIGAATGPASVALLARGWARGYAPAPSALVCLMGDGAPRGALSVAQS
jgi:3-oxoacyl-[acyl-carrier-protein] synthase-1